MYFLVISGSRDIQPGSPQWSRVESLVEMQKQSTIIVHGGCKTGADKAAHDACEKHERTEFNFRAFWKKQGRSAGPKRNTRMMKFIADMLAFEDTVAEVHCFFLKGAKNIGTTNAYNAAMKYKLFPVKHQ